MRASVILCPIDFSACSRAAFLEACDLAVRDEARLVLVHVYQPIMPVTPEVPVLPVDLTARDLAEREQRLDEARAEALARGVRGVTAQLEQGAPWDRIVAAARGAGCQLIVMGTHGRTGLRHVLIGSVAEKVTRHAPCSVLVVRPLEGAA